MKNKNSITLKKLCIIIIICLACIFLSLSILRETYAISNLEKYVSQMELLQENVNKIRNNYILWEKYNPNEPSNYYSYLQELGYINANSTLNIYKEEFVEIIERLDSKNLEYWNKDIDINITNYCYFTPKDVNKHFELKEFEDDVIINFYTGNIISKNGILDIYLNELIYRQYDSVLGNALKITPIDNTSVYAKLEIVENYGLKQKIEISLVSEDEKNIIPDILDVYYITTNSDTKKKCSELRDYTYNSERKSAMFTIDVSDYYSFIVEDSNFIQYDKIEHDFELCNSPQLNDGMIGIYWDENGVEKQINSIYDENWYDYSSSSLKFANAKTEDGSYWVWIPRFAYKENLDNIEINFINGTSFTSTSTKSLNGFKTPELFQKSTEILGFWINKFQMNVESEIATSIPGQTLTVLKCNEAKAICSNYLEKCQIMSNNDYDAVMLLSKFYNISISNDLVHYAGGATTTDGFLHFVQYSSTNNCYGVYDLLTSENELTYESHGYEEGRFRFVMK